MVKLQLEHQTTASKLMREKFQRILDTLHQKKEYYEQKMKECKDLVKSFNYYSTLYCDFVRYCDRLPVLGFNSQGYDIPLIRKYLPSSLNRLDTLPSLSLIHI